MSDDDYYRRREEQRREEQRQEERRYEAQREDREYERAKRERDLKEAEAAIRSGQMAWAASKLGFYDLAIEIARGKLNRESDAFESSPRAGGEAEKRAALELLSSASELPADLRSTWGQRLKDVDLSSIDPFKELRKLLGEMAGLRKRPYRAVGRNELGRQQRLKSFLDELIRAVEEVSSKCLDARLTEREKGREKGGNQDSRA